MGLNIYQTYAQSKYSIFNKKKCDTLNMPP